MKTLTLERYLSRLRSGRETLLSVRSQERPMKVKLEVKEGVPFSGCQGTSKGDILSMMSCLS